MNTMGERLLYLRKQTGLKQSEIAEKIGISSSNISRIEKNEINPSSTIILQICNFFNISADWLLFGKDPSEAKSDDYEFVDETNLLIDNIKQLSKYGKWSVINYSAEILGKEKKERFKASKSKKRHQPEAMPAEPIMVTIPVYDSPSSAGSGNFLSDNETYTPMEFNEEEVPYGTDFGVRISGDSMEPKIKDNSIVFVKQCCYVPNEQIGIFILNGEGYCKKVLDDHSERKSYLVSLNPEYEPIEITPYDDFWPVGKVLFFRPKS